MNLSDKKMKNLYVGRYIHNKTQFNIISTIIPNFILGRYMYKVNVYSADDEAFIVVLYLYLQRIFDIEMSFLGFISFILECCEKLNCFSSKYKSSIFFLNLKIILLIIFKKKKVKVILNFDLILFFITKHPFRYPYTRPYIKYT